MRFSIKLILVTSAIIFANMLFAPSAHAYTIYPNYPGVTPPCGPYDSIDQCFWSPMGTGTVEICKDAISYETCKAKCDCQFTKDKKACNGSGPCIDLAVAEHNACLGNCITDWA